MGVHADADKVIGFEKVESLLFRQRHAGSLGTFHCN
jgi:hypothetical protein